MARYKHVDMSPRLLPVVLEEQLVPGTFADVVHHLIDGLKLDAFDARYNNDKTGAPAHSPAMLLKAVLLAYSQGLISSRQIANACERNVQFIAITGDAKPHFTTIADFVSRSHDAIASVFAQVLTVLGDEGMIGRQMFAIDGVKLPSNASKHQSGTREDFIDRAKRFERAAEQMLSRHRDNDDRPAEDLDAKATAKLKRITGKANKLSQWLKDHPDDRIGASGKPIKSNTTDNESAKMATDKGVIQGYCGIAIADAQHQVIVHAQAHGSCNENAELMPALEACADQRRPDTLITADAGFHSNDNMDALHEQQINALIADRGMQRRHSSNPDKYARMAKALQDKGPKKKPASKYFRADDFTVTDDGNAVICPAGKTLPRNGRDMILKGYLVTKYRAPLSACRGCELRSKCLRNAHDKAARQVSITHKRPNAASAMRERIDSELGREQYSRRIGTIEPVFGNIRYNKRLNRFTLRGTTKVDGQWKLYALVHNIEKLANYRKAV